MAINDITFVRGQGGLGRAATGEDYISGMLFLADALPSGYDSANRVKQVLSVQDAENLGIAADYSDETKATATVDVDTLGATGDSCVISILEPLGEVILCDYKVTATETTAALQSAAIATAINANTYIHGYVATYVSGTSFTLTARAGLGYYLNGNNFWSLTSTGSLLVLGAADFSGGVASLLAQWHYHIAEYYRLNPTGNLWVGFYAITGNSYNFAELLAMQDAADGKIRQFGIYLNNTQDFISAGDIMTAVPLIQTQLNALEDAHFPCSAVLTTDISQITDLTTLSDISTLDARGVTVVIGQDGANNDGTKSGLGHKLFMAQGHSIGMMGAVLGAASRAKVSISPAWVQEFNFTDGNELAFPAFANDRKVNRVTDKNLLDQLNARRYVFLIYYPGKSGSYLNDNHCAITRASDYAYMNDNRTIDKVHRVAYASLLNPLNGPLTLNSDGTLADTTIAYLTGQVDDNLDQMVRDGELSGKRVTINPAQNVLATSTVVVAVTLLPLGVTRNITVNAKYTTTL